MTDLEIGRMFKNIAHHLSKCMHACITRCRVRKAYNTVGWRYKEIEVEIEIDKSEGKGRNVTSILS